MKIEVDPQVLRDIAAYCNEQQSIMNSTKAYLDQHGKIAQNDFGLLLMMARPLYEMCRTFTMDGFNLGARLVKSRADAMQGYIEEQSSLEDEHLTLLEQIGKRLQQSGGGMKAGGGQGGGGVPGARPGSPQFATNEEPVHPGEVGTSQGGGGGIGQAGAAPLNSQPPGPPQEMARGGMASAEPLNPQPLPPGPPPEMGRPEALSGSPEVMDKVWQERSNSDPLGRSPEVLKDMWAARQPVQPPLDQQSLMMQSAMDSMSKVQQQAANVMKIVSDAQMAALASNSKF